MAVNPKPCRRKEKRWLRQYKAISKVKIRMRLYQTGARINRVKMRGFVSGIKHYVLKKRRPIIVDFLMWAMWFEHKENRLVKQTKLFRDTGVSTIFLGLDHSYFSGEKPLIFETMIFGGDHNGYQDRYATWEEAEAGHEKAIQLIFEVPR